MSLWRNFSVKVRRRETPVYDLLYRVARRILIGPNCTLGSEVTMTDNSGHFLDAKERCVPDGGQPYPGNAHPTEKR